MSEQNNSVEQTKQDMAKVYGIKLTDIEEVILPDGKEYFKFVNPEDRTTKMIENRKDSFNLSEQFKELQSALAISQTENERQNAKAVFDYQLKYQNIELRLIPVRELNGNKLSYKHLFEALEPNKKKAIRVLLENMEYLELEYINLENCFGIDKDNHVITSNYNVITGKCELATAEVRSYDNEKTDVGDESYTFDITDEEFDAVIEQIDVAEDTPIIVEPQEVEVKQQTKPNIRGHEINLNFALQAYHYPEIIDRSELSYVDKMIYRGVIAAIHRKKQKAKGMEKAKQYVLTQKKPNQAAFVDSILLALLLGFFSGLLLTMIYLAIKAGI